jgi:hypothetical protein
MTKSWRRTTLGALVALLLVPAAANAAVSGSLTQQTLTPGCQPKGLLAFGAPKSGGPGVSAGAHSYTVVAVFGGSLGTPCLSQPVSTGPGADSAFIQWNSTPGATGYKIYRDNAALILGAGPVKVYPASAACPPGGNGPRCVFQDNGGPSDPSDAPPAGPAAQTQAGSSADLVITESIDYGVSISSNPNAALKTNVYHLPPGLVANPGATTQTCKLSGTAPSLIGDPSKFGSNDPDEDTCPRASLVGTVQALISTPGGPRLSEGDIYLGNRLGNETARLFIALRPACSAGSFIAPGSATCNATVGSGNEVEKSFLSAKATIRNDGTFGIDNELTSVADGSDKPLSPVLNVRKQSDGSVAAQIPIQVQRQVQTLFGSADQGTADTSDDRPFIVLPTSCTTKTITADLTTYLDETVTHLTSNDLVPTNCAAVPFTPQAAFSIDVSGGQANAQGHPSFTAAVTQPAGQAAQKKAVVTLPRQLRVNANAVGSTCHVANPASASECPDSAIIGSATATTSLLPGTLSGPVYLTQGSALPDLDVFLSGPADIHLHGSTGLATVNGETRLVNTFDNLPEVPLTSFVLTVKGGTNGLLENAESLCNGVGDATAEFTGHNGATVTRTAAVESNAEYYCVPGKATRPKFAIHVQGVKKGHPRVAGSVRRGASDLRSHPRKVRVFLPKGMRFTRNAKRRITVRVDGKKVRTFTARKRLLKIRPGHRARRFTFSTRKGAIRESRKIRRKGRKQHLRFRALIKVEGGKTFHFVRRVRPRS